MKRRSKKKQRIPKQVVVPQEPQKRLEAFWQQIRWVQRDWKALGTKFWMMHSCGSEFEMDFWTEVEAWKGLGFNGWIIHSRLYKYPYGYFFHAWMVVDGDQQRIWYPKTGRTIPFSSLDTTPLILYPQRDEAEESQSDTRRVQCLYPRQKIIEWDVTYPGGVFKDISQQYGIIFDVAYRPIVTDGVQFWWAWTRKEHPPTEMADKWDTRHLMTDKYYLENLFDEAEPDEDAWKIPERRYNPPFPVVQQWLRKWRKEIERLWREENKKFCD